MGKPTEVQFRQAVISEVIKLRRHLTDEQKDKLDFSDLEPDDYKHCIYGQATGDCFSEEAARLMSLCSILRWGEDNNALEGYKGLILDRNDFPGLRSYSDLEEYITLPGSKNEHIIEFIKGDTDTLKL